MPHPPRLKRADSFFGLHFDFHANAKDRNIGARTTRRMITKLLKSVRPDYIQIDCKGHAGWTSYPTRVGNAAPGIVRDALPLWRAVTAERGVSLFMHYSGVWDTQALKRHPSWARVDENGKRDKDKTSVFGAYSVRLLIPQLKELSDRYGLDGAWVDGDCWATMPDYRPDVLAAFRHATGIRNVPRKPGDPNYAEFIAFCREGFRRYLRHYLDVLRRHNPDFQVTSNWSFSSFMPEPVSANVPFLSGDYSWTDSINTARFEGRWLAQQGRPWDLMAWSFSGEMARADWSTKSVPQLQREAAAVIALGGGFQAYFRQQRDGSIREHQIPLMAETARFCRARQPFCHRGATVPQIALLYSGAAYYRQQPGVFQWPDRYLNGLRGSLQALLDGQHVVNVVGEHHLAGRMRDYPLIVVPEWDFLARAFRRDLLRYVRDGGKLLLIGPGPANLFRRELGVRLRGKPEDRRDWLVHNDAMSCLLGLAQSITPLRGTRTLGTLCREDDPRTATQPAATIRRLGRGTIAAVYANLGSRYRTSAVPAVRDFLTALVRALFPKPLVTVQGSSFVDVSALRVGETLTVHLVNTAGPHADRSVSIHDDIPPVGPLTIALRLARRPRAITLQPANRRLRVAWRAGVATVTLPRLAIHDILVVD